GSPAGPPSGSPAGVCAFHPDRPAGIRCQRCERTICPDCMNPAAVGFQCPACVREGARSVRRARTPYGGAVPARPALTSQVLIALNVAVWLAVTATGAGASAWVDRLGLIPLGRCEPVGGGGYFPGVVESVCRQGGAVW